MSVRIIYMYTCSTTVKFVNALNKPPLNYRLAIKDSARSNYVYRISNPTMVEIGTTNPEYQPLRAEWHLFTRPRSKTILLEPIHLFTR